MSVSDLIASWPRPTGASPLDAANDLAAHLESGGIQPHVMNTVHGMTGLAIVHLSVDDEDHVVLVHTGSEDETRAAVDRFAATPMPAKRRWVATTGAVPVDVDAVFGANPLADCEQALMGSRSLRLDRPLNELDAIIAEVRPTLESAFGRSFDPANGEDTLRAIDAAVAEARPAQVADDHVVPLRTLMALGLIACRTMIDLAGQGRLFKMNGSQPGQMDIGDAVTLADVEGFPAVRFTDELGTAVARKVAKRWFDPNQGLVDLWAMVRSEMGEVTPVDPEVAAVQRDRLLAGIGIAAKQTWLYLSNLAEGTECMPSLWAFDGEQVSMDYLVAENSGHALEMVERQVTEYAGAMSVSSVIDLYVWSDEERVDCLVVQIFLPDTDVRATLMVPYRVEDGVFSYPAKPWLREVRALDVDESDVAQAFFAGFQTVEGVVAEQMGTSFGDPISATTTPTAPAPSAAASPSEPTADDALAELVAMAPTAGFLVVAAADGELEPEEVTAFTESVARVDNPMLQGMIGHGDPQKQIEAMMAEPKLIPLTIKAAGKLFAETEGGEAAREAYMKLMYDVANTHGHVRLQERRALDRIERLLDGRGSSSALFGLAILGGGLLVSAGIGAGVAALVGVSWVLGAVAGPIGLIGLVYTLRS